MINFKSRVGTAPNLWHLFTFAEKSLHDFLFDVQFAKDIHGFFHQIEEYLVKVNEPKGACICGKLGKGK